MFLTMPAGEGYLVSGSSPLGYSRLLARFHVTKKKDILDPSRNSRVQRYSYNISYVTLYIHPMIN